MKCVLDVPRDVGLATRCAGCDPVLLLFTLLWPCAQTVHVLQLLGSIEKAEAWSLVSNEAMKMRYNHVTGTAPLPCKRSRVCRGLCK